VSRRTIRSQVCTRRSRLPEQSLRNLPAYSPNLNHIENVCAKLKSELRGGSSRRRYAPRLASCKLKPIAPAECAGCFSDAGYRA